MQKSITTMLKLFKTLRCKNELNVKLDNDIAQMISVSLKVFANYCVIRLSYHSLHHVSSTVSTQKKKIRQMMRVWVGFLWRICDCLCNWQKKTLYSSYFVNSVWPHETRLPSTGFSISCVQHLIPLLHDPAECRKCSWHSFLWDAHF